MSTPSALKNVAAPIADLKPRSLILSGAGIVPLGFVAGGDGTVVVKWSSPLDPANPNESLPVVNGAQYTCQIDTIISSDVDLLFFFGDIGAGSSRIGGGASSGGGGGDASAANQTLILNAIDAIYDALALVGTEVTSAEIRDAVTNLGAGSTLSDLAAAFSADAVVQADILAALQASEIDIDAIKSGIDLLVPDLDAVRVAVEATNAKIPASPAEDRTTFAAPNATRIVNAGSTAFVTPLTDTELRTTPVPISGTVTATVSDVSTNTALLAFSSKFAAATTHSDGAAQTATTQVRAVLTGVNTAAWGGANTLSAPAVDARGVAVQGYVAAGSAVNASHRPLTIGITDGTNVRIPLGDSNGKLIIAGSTITNAPVVAFDPVHTGAFNDLVAEYKTQIFGKNFGSNVFVSQLDVTTVANGGTVDVNSNRLRIQTNTTNGASAIYNSYKIATYREGMGMQFRFTAAFTTGVASSSQVVGAFTPDFANGYGFGYNGTAFAIFHRNGGADSAVANTYPLAQASWNGNVPPGFDPTKGNVYRIDYPFLGYGDVRFFIQDSASGQWFLVHVIRYANASSTIQLAEPALQFAARGLSTGSTTNLTIFVGSYAAFLIGERRYNGAQWSKSNAKANVTTATSVLALRNCTTYNGKTNKRIAHIRSISTTVDAGNGYALVRAVVNPTVAIGTAAFTPLSGSTADNGVTLTSAQSVLSYDTGIITITGGTERWGNAQGRNSSSTPVDVPNQDLFIYPGETWVFEFAPNTSMDCAIAINGQED